MPKPLLETFIEAGLLQFGLFGEEESPIRMNLHLLPAYPDILAQIAETALHHIDHNHIERLVCDAKSLPFGVATSLRSGIPLVYSLGSDQPGVFDLVGAYDVGHPTLLLTNTWRGNADGVALIKKARAVGLNINTVLTVFDYGKRSTDSLEVRALLRLADIIPQLVESGELPPGQAQAIAQWLGGD